MTKFVLRTSCLLLGFSIFVTLLLIAIDMINN